jgi:hypothetical protein
MPEPELSWHPGVVTAVGVILAVLLFLNRNDIAQHSPVPDWAWVIPALAVVLWGLMDANYEKWGQMEYVLTHHMNVAVSEIAEDGPRGEVVYTTTKRTDELLFHPDVVDRATAYIAVGKWDPRV